MTTKKRLHLLVDQLLPEWEQTAREVPEALSATGDPVLYTLDIAAPDDEPYTDEERSAVAEAREDVSAGRVHSLPRRQAEAWSLSWSVSGRCSRRFAPSFLPKRELRTRGSRIPAYACSLFSPLCSFWVGSLPQVTNARKIGRRRLGQGGCG
jgi:hypothetical protein